MDGYLILQLIVLLAHFGISWLVIWLVYKIFKRLILLLKTPISGTNNSSLNLFLSFGVTLIFFKDTVIQSIYKIWRFVISPLDSVRLIKSNFSDTTMNNDSLEEDVANFMFEWAENLEQAFVTNILNFNYTGIIIFLAFWLLISLLFREIEQSINEADTEKRMGKLNDFTGNTTIKNILTLIILVFSIYLSISSIVAVPEFQSLEAVRTETDINKKFSEELENQKLFSKENLIIAKDTTLKNESEISEFDNIIRRLQESVDDYNTWVNTNWVRDEKAKKIAINRLKAAVDEKMGVKERINYKLALTDWYLSFHENWTFGISFHQSKLISISESIREIISDENNIVMDTVYLDITNFRLVPKINSYVDSRLERISDDLWGFTSQLYAINVKYDTNRIPEKPQIGEKFGVFNTISGWLLRTESLSLALIVGLFGFGLLGSIGSTFIRRRIKNVADNESDDTTIVTYDMQGILINGISAAIVVFLAVKGAVVIFSTDGDNLNPYILFFTCLVASVFSEDVWRWARTKLNQNLGNSAEGRSGDGNNGQNNDSNRNPDENDINEQSDKIEEGDNQSSNEVKNEEEDTGNEIDTNISKEPKDGNEEENK